jgi:Skp family chaperone for outer membrane proteins
MRGLAIAVGLSAALSAPALAQAQTPPARPAQPATPAQPPAAQAPAAQPLPPSVPFPTGAKVGFVNLQAIAQLTADGKAAATRVNALAQKKQTEGAEKTKALQANQQKLQTGGGVMSDAARGQLEREIERQTVDGQRFEQDAQAELNELQQELQKEFQAKLLPVLEAISKEKGLQVLFSAADAGVIWVEPGIDLTMEAVKRMDAMPKAPAAPAPAAPR